LPARVASGTAAAGIHVLLSERALGEARGARDALAAELPNFQACPLIHAAHRLAAVAYAQVLREALTGTGLFDDPQGERRRELPVIVRNTQECERLMSDMQRARVLLSSALRADGIRTRADALRPLPQCGEEIRCLNPESAEDGSGGATTVLVEIAGNLSGISALASVPWLRFRPVYHRRQRDARCVPANITSGWSSAAVAKCF
jgi:hypothetical protein